MEKRQKPGPKPSVAAAKRVKFTTKLDGQLLAKFKKKTAGDGLKANEVIESLIGDFLGKGGVETKH